MLIPSTRRRGTLVAAITIAALGVPVSTTTAHAAPAPRAGLVGRPVLLQDHTPLSGYDVATDSAGNFYIGWISGDSSTTTASRKVRFCTVRPGGSACAGGVQVIDALGASSAAGLRVLATPAGAVSLVWFHDTTPDSVNGPRGGRLAIATSQSGGALSAATDVADAPSFGALLDAQYGPGGSIWTVAYKGVGTKAIEVRPGFAQAPQTVTTPYSVGTTRLAFAGATAVIATHKYGSITDPVAFARRTGGKWSSFTSVAGTWSSESVGLAATASGVRLIASTNNATYRPAVSKFNGTGFSAPRLNGDRSACPALTIDVASDASGRLADVRNRCGQIAVTNMPDTANAALAGFPAGGTVNGVPQIATTPRGHGVVAWAVTSTAGSKLMFGRVLLPALNTAVDSAAAASGRVSVTGPASCLPAVAAGAAVRPRAAAGWKVTSAVLLLDNKPFAGTILNGSNLIPGRVYSLTGRAVFTRGTTSVTGAATLRFRSCGKP